MSNELEALVRLGRYHIEKDDIHGFEIEDTEDYALVEKALKRLDVYDKCNYQTTIHKDVLQISKELKALEIIKEKRVNVWILTISKDVKIYNASIPNDFMKHLTKEEFDLLKEVLKDE